MSQVLTLIAALTCLAASPAAAAEPTVLVTHDHRVTAIAFSRDSKQLVSADAGGLVIMTDVATRKRLSTYRHALRENSELNPVSVDSLAFSPDGSVLATGFTDWVKDPERGLMEPVGAVRLWDLATGNEVATVRGEVLTNPVPALAFAPDAKYFAAGGPSPYAVRLRGNAADRELGELKVWDRRTLRLRFTARSRFGFVHAVAFSPDGTTLACGSGDGSSGDDDAAERRGEVTFWDVEKGTETDKLAWRGAGVFTVAFSSKGSVMAVGGGVPPGLRVVGGKLSLREPVGRLVLWDYKGKKEIAQLKGHRYPVYRAAFSPDGRLLAAGGGDYSTTAVELKVWDVAARHEVADLARSLKPMVTSVAFSPDGKLLAAASDKNVVFLWDVAGLNGGKPRQ